jgi:hypothetical protein
MTECPNIRRLIFQSPKGEEGRAGEGEGREEGKGAVRGRGGRCWEEK